MLLLILLSLAAVDTPTTPAAKTTKLAALSPDKVICREQPVTGSLIQTSKTCKTRREWDQQREALRTGPASDSCRAAAEGGSC